MNKLITILVPCYNEEAVIEKFHQRTSTVISSITDINFELLFINDGSRDNAVTAKLE